MDILLEHGLTWWITVVDLPAMAAMFWMIWRSRSDHEVRESRLRELIDYRHLTVQEQLADFKLDVARHYASQDDLKVLESRIVAHLLRIEAKLERRYHSSAE